MYGTTRKSEIATNARERETRSRDAGGAHEEGMGRAVSEGFVWCRAAARGARRGGDTARRSRTRDVQGRGPSSRRRRRCVAEESRRFCRTLTTAAGPSGDPRRSFRIATSAAATVCGSSASSLSRAMVSRSAASRSSRVGGSPPPIANNGETEAGRVAFVSCFFRFFDEANSCIVKKRFSSQAAATPPPARANDTVATLSRTHSRHRIARKSCMAPARPGVHRRYSTSHSVSLYFPHIASRSSHRPSHASSARAASPER